MNLNLEQIKAIAKGAARVEQAEDGIHLLRFTKEQEELYRIYSSDFWKKTFATAGVRLEFRTTSQSLSMAVRVAPASSRLYFFHDIYCNDKMIGQLGNSESNEGTYSGTYALGDGMKTVRVYFPWSTASTLIRFTLDDGCQILPIQKNYKMLSYGDSITHGYDALSPSHSYASLLADALDAEAFNKGIGGEVFFPALAEISDEISPDLITVAYGTNDWSKCSRQTFEANCAAFYQALSKRNPDAKIFAITPIWRGDFETKTSQVGSFSYIAEYIERIAATLPNVTVIHGFDFVPKDESYFRDKYLHPNDKGFTHYFNNLHSEIKKYL